VATAIFAAPAQENAVLRQDLSPKLVGISPQAPSLRENPPWVVHALETSLVASFYLGARQISVTTTQATALPEDISAFFDVSLDLLIIRDIEGRVLKASRSWLAQLGHDPKDMEGLKLLRLVHPGTCPAR
jgi:PAS domain-containing protein